MARPARIGSVLVAAFLLASTAVAEIYTWEDAESVHFSDTPPSAPERFGGRLPDEADPGDKPDSAPSVAPRTGHAALEQPRAAMAANRGKADGVPVTPRKAAGSTFPSLATLVVLSIVLALFLFVMWIATIADTVRSTFTTPSIKTAWVLLVIFLPVVGMLCYYILGLSQKCDPTR